MSGSEGLRGMERLNDDDVTNSPNSGADCAESACNADAMLNTGQDLAAVLRALEVSEAT